MSMLMRAPRECASWEWELEDFADPGLGSALMVASQMSAVLREQGLIEPEGIEWLWFVRGVGGIGVTTRLSVSGLLNDVQLVERVLQSRPTGFPDAEVGAISVTGPGLWLDAEGVERYESGLVSLSVSPDDISLAADLSVHHDIWGYCDFKGVPHPEIQKRNAPRLTAALRSLTELLGTEAQPGEPTYFGQAVGYEVAMPHLINGLGPDLSDRL
ncbi:hypothetical protein ABZS76_31395 [Streptomyces sp. NPDC005562]|uniref:hypothetical protein n=1 Tax=unclassified Streptomyces TaxID=2593676 RepID=UPI0033A78E42